MSNDTPLGTKKGYPSGHLVTKEVMYVLGGTRFGFGLDDVSLKLFVLPKETL